MDVGDGRSTFFWEDRWLHGMMIQEIAPRIYDRIRPRTRSGRTVADALEGTWTQYLVVWEHIFMVDLRRALATLCAGLGNPP